MKYFYLILFTTILAGCGNSNFNQYQSQFLVNNPNSIHPDSIDIQSLSSISDMDLLKQLMSPFYSNPEDLDLVLKYQQFYFYSWMGEQQGMNKFSILQTEGEYPCIKNFYMFITKEGKILDKKSIASDACLEMGIDRSNFQNVNDSSFNVNYYIHDYQSFLPTPYVEECTITADGKIACIKRDLSVGMCNWDKLSVRATPSDKGKYLTSINLGEKINVLGKFQVDEESDKKNEYALVSLSDNSQGWVQRRFIGENAYPAAITKETYIYKRADPLTRTNDKFYEFDVVAIGERDDSAEWYKVKGKPRGGNWFKTGWIKAEYFSTSDLNVAYSAMVSKSMVDDNYDELMNIAMNKEFDITDLSLRKALFNYLDIENVREYSGEEIESAVGEFFGSYVDVIEDGETFTRFNETCEQEVFIFEDGRITHDVVYDSEIYSLVSVSVKNFGETVELNLESMSTKEPAMLSIFESKGMKVLTPEWSYEDYFVFEEDAIDLPEDPEECAMEVEDM